MVSIRTKIMTAFFLMALLPAVVVSIYYYSNVRKTIEINIGNNNERVLSAMSDGISSRLNLVIKLSDWTYFDENILKLLKKNNGSVRDMTTLAAVRSMEEQFKYAAVSRYMKSFFLLGENGAELRAGEGFLTDLDALQQTDYYNEILKNDGRTVIGGIAENRALYSDQRYVLPIGKVLKDFYTNQDLGVVLFLYEPRIVSDNLNMLELQPGESVFLVDQNGRIIYSNGAEKQGKKIEEFIPGQCLQQIKQDGYQVMKIDNNQHMILQKVIPESHWYILAVLSMEEVAKQRHIVVISWLTVLMMVFFFTVIVGLLLTRYLGKPIEYLVRQMDKISKGDLDRKIEVYHSKEIFDIGKSVERMVQSLKISMQEAVAREEEKRNLEMKMLQNQINPHFLYNTLNTIKLMASLQGAHNISELIGHLGNLLQFSFRGIGEEVKVREEISALKNYVYIQNVCYREKINFVLNADESVLDCLIPKLILQPLAENAIFHGIVPKEMGGVLKVTVSDNQSVIKICVEDDGIGMEPETIELLLHNTSRQDSRGVGVYNVHRRLVLRYGPQSGLQIESKKGNYTKVTFVIPKREEKSLEKCSDSR